MEDIEAHRHVLPAQIRTIAIGAKNLVFTAPRTYPAKCSIVYSSKDGAGEDVEVVEELGASENMWQSINVGPAPCKTYTSTGSLFPGSRMDDGWLQCLATHPLTWLQQIMFVARAAKDGSHVQSENTQMKRCKAVLLDRKPMKDGSGGGFVAVNIDGELHMPVEAMCRLDVEPKRLTVAVL